jgi:uncharacterized protein (DUF305 family)
MKRLPALAAAAVAVVLAVTGCGGGDTGSQTADQFNEADVAFAQQMIPHHQQAIQMAQHAEQRAASAEVKKLAGEIERAQDPEIQTMTGWLQAWGKEVPKDMAGMGHGGTDMPGMMSDQELNALEDASGATFDRMFLRMMIKHHEGAIQVVRTEQANGQNTDATTLAREIETAQTAEIGVMKRLLGT